MNHNHFRTTEPPTRVNDAITLSPKHREIFNRHYRDVNNRVADQNIPGPANHPENFFKLPTSNKSFVYLITETLGEFPNVYFTEKTWKAMTSCSPFMIIGVRFSLRTLQEFGFQTFGRWFDESYDAQENIGDRVELAVKEIKRLSQLQPNELTDIRNEMRPVLEHNFYHLKKFAQDDLSRLRKNL